VHLITSPFELSTSKMKCMWLVLKFLLCMAARVTRSLQQCIQLLLFSCVRYDGAIQPVEEQPSSLELDFANDKLRRLRRAFMAQKQAQEMQAQLSDFTPGTTARDGLASSTSSSLAYGSMGGAGAGDQQVAWAGAAVAIAHAAAEHVSAAAAHVAAVAAEPEGQQPGAVLALEDALRAALDKVEGLRARAGAPTATADASAVAVDSSEGASNSI